MNQKKENFEGQSIFKCSVWFRNFWKWNGHFYLFICFSLVARFLLNQNTKLWHFILDTNKCLI